MTADQTAQRLAKAELVNCRWHVPAADFPGHQVLSLESAHGNGASQTCLEPADAELIRAALRPAHGERDEFLTRLDIRIRLMQSETGTWHNEDACLGHLSGLLTARHFYTRPGELLRPDCERVQLIEALTGNLLDETEDPA
jgi:hypothetical protein